MALPDLHIPSEKALSLSDYQIVPSELKLESQLSIVHALFI